MRQKESGGSSLQKELKKPLHLKVELRNLPALGNTYVHNKHGLFKSYCWEGAGIAEMQRIFYLISLNYFFSLFFSPGPAMMILTCPGTLLLATPRPR